MKNYLRQEKEARVASKKIKIGIAEVVRITEIVKNNSEFTTPGKGD